MKKMLLLGIASIIFIVQPMLASNIIWTDWTSATAPTPNTLGSVIGVMGGVNVAYTGKYSFVQLGSDTNYWIEKSPKPYTGNTIVENAPTASELIALDLATTNTITFSNAITNPIMAIVSLGRPATPISYDFDTPFTILSEGQGYWGDGTGTTSAGDILTGYEFHGVIQFSGTVSSISWTNSPNEYWHGVTIGMESNPVPEPTSLILLGTGILGIGLAAYRRKKA